jgi:hypothetical protein
LEAAVWARLAGCASADRVGDQAAVWQAWAESAALRWRVLSGPDPLSRLDPDPSRRPGQPWPAADRASCQAQAEAELARAEQNARALALDASASGAEAVWWAGLAAASAQARHGLAGVSCQIRPVQPWTTVATIDPAAGLSGLIEAYHRTVFAVGAALGLVGSGDPASQPLRTVLESARRQRDDLVELALAQGQSVPVAAVAYDLPPAGDPASALALVGSAQAALASAAAEWVRSSPEQRPLAVPALIDAALLALPVGQGCAAWPGWPD